VQERVCAVRFRVLQAAFGWEDMHLHRFTTGDPFAPLRPIDGEVPEALHWLPRQECEEPTDRPEEDCSLDQLLALGSGEAFYDYDFGDSWLHRLELVSRRPMDGDRPPARLVDGARRGPWAARRIHNESFDALVSNTGMR
jgi:hypothetical protein